MSVFLSRRTLLRSSALGVAALSAPAVSLAASEATNSLSPARRDDENDESLVTGAFLDETSVRVTVDVDASGQTPGSVRTLKEGLGHALDSLKAGTPTRVRVHGGVYREGAMDVLFTDATARETLLVIEAAPNARVVWSGADVFPSGEWKDEGNGLFSHAWPFEFGNFAYPWGAPGVLAHRREMVWMNEAPLRPVLLETYEVTGFGRFNSPGPVTWTYKAFLDPKKTLKAGEFGVAERAENGKRIWIRLAPGQKIGDVEVAARPALLNVAGKTRLVVRGITFEKCANSDRDFGRESPVSFGESFRTENRPGDVLLERCAFRWNSGAGFNLTGWRWTVRDCDFSYNGFSGLTSGDARNVLMERVSANFNCWREFFAGEEDWNYSAMKFHSTERHLVRGVTAVGNADHGLWWDVHCGQCTLEDAVFIGNRRSFIFELSEGPFVARRVLGACGYMRVRDNPLDANPTALSIGTSQRVRIEDSLFYTDTAPSLAAIFWYERDDPHAQQRILRPELYDVRGSVFVAGPHVRDLFREANVGDRKSENYRAFLYRGQNNVFFAQGQNAKPFGYHDANYTPVLQTFAEWAARSETNARYLDPHLRDPANYDFRFAPDSPLARDAKRLPQYVLPAALRREMEAFWKWLGWDAKPPVYPTEKKSA